MSVFHENMLIGSSGQGAPAAAGISRSLRFNSSDSAYLSRTPASAGNRKTWTWAGWVKRSGLGATQRVFSTSNSGNTEGFYFEITSSDTISFYDYSNPTVFWQKTTTQVFRDASAWYHMVIAFDSTQATAANRFKFYVNGTQVDAFSTSSDPSLNYDSYCNAARVHAIGRTGDANAGYFSGYLADIYFIDGQALTPSSFTETDATTGQLIPKAYTGSYGTNGFHLEFADNSAATATTLGKDTSGNGNNWTPNNLSVTAGAGNDSLVDVPTNGTASSGGDAGGTTTGNYCTLNPLNSGGSGTPTLTNGNLEFSLGPSVGAIGTYSMGSIAPTTGKWYWELSLTSNYLSSVFFGLMRGADHNTYGSSTGVSYYGYDGTKYVDGTASSYGSSYTNGDIIGVALNLDSGTVTFYKNNSSQGAITLPSSTSGWKAYVANGASGGTQAGVINFGQRAFAYTAPSGFKALCTTNLPAPLVTKPSTVMDVKLYTGTGSSQSITGLGFSPDFVWFKNRSGANSHALFDTVRGRASGLFSDSTGAEQTSSVGNDLSSFDSAGFTVGTPQNFNSPNINGGSIVAWTWDAGTTTVTNNTAGTITPTGVRANATAGFSVVTFTAQSSGSATIGHGLGVEPHLIIVKSRAQTYSWLVYHKNLTSNAYYLILNSTAAQDNTSNAWNSTTPTSTVFTLGSTYAGGGNSVAYCFAPVVGYSSFGSYTGNGSSDGPFVYTGFRPAFVMLKESSASGNGWEIRDSMREPYNDSNRTILLPNLSNAEITDAFPIDFTSSGFKVRNTGGGSNNSGATYIYAAFAESPFNYARAR
jgi:hypothetical protein